MALAIFTYFYILLGSLEITMNMKIVAGFILFFILLVGSYSEVLGQGPGQSCPVTSTGSFNYVANISGSGSGDWSSASTWSTVSWKTPVIPPSTGAVGGSIAINGSVSLHNSGSTIEFNQSTTICGTLTIDGNMATSGGASPLNVYGTLIVYGSLTTGQSIVVHEGAQLIVYGDWNITGGSNADIKGTMAVKGNVDNKQGITMSTAGNLLIYGSYTAVSASNSINGNMVVTGPLSVPSWYTKGGSGNVYSLGGGTWGRDATLGSTDLNNNTALSNLYNSYQSLFGLAALSATITSSPASPVCAGTTVTYTAACTGATSFSFYINSSTTAAQSGSGTTFSYAPSNGDVVTVVAANASQSTNVSSSAAVVNPLPNPTFIAASTSTCAGTSLSVSLGKAYSSYTWSVTPSSLSLGTSPAPTQSAIVDIPENDVLFPRTSSLTSIAGTLSVVVTDAKGCSNASPASYPFTIFRIPRTGPPFHIGNNVAF